MLTSADSVVAQSGPGALRLVCSMPTYLGLWPRPESQRVQSSLLELMATRAAPELSVLWDLVIICPSLQPGAARGRILGSAPNTSQPQPAFLHGPRPPSPNRSDSLPSNPRQPHGVFDRIGVFVTATGTDVGKTLVSRGLLLALGRRGLRVAGVKPIETGCTPFPRDAELLARASGSPELAHGSGWYRAEPPLAPYAVELTAGVAAPDVAAISERAQGLARTYDALLVEGAGGLLVPLSRSSSMADLACEFQLPLLLVADDRLGVLSHVLPAYEAAQQRALEVLAIVLNQCSLSVDPSAGTNLQILRERLPCPILPFPHLPNDDDESLVLAAESSGLADLCSETFASAVASKRARSATLAT